MEVLDLVPSRPSSGGKPVFVDPHGRRARWTGVAGRLVAGGTALYLVLVVASLVGAPWVPRVGLPSVGPAPRTVHTTSAVTLPASAQRQATPTLGHPAKASTPTTTVTGGGAGSSVVTSPPVTAARAAVTTAPGQARTSTTTTPSRSAATTTPPGRSGSAPGKSR